MFIRERILDPLSAALLNVVSWHDREEDTVDGTRLKVLQILLVFSQVSQSNIHVRNHWGQGR
jgi:hypothetical protein